MGETQWVTQLSRISMHLNVKIAIADAVQLVMYSVLSPIFLVIYIVQLVMRYLDDSKEVESKHVLITGATSGLGQALALKYAKTAATLCLFGRNEEKLEETRNACKEVNRKCNVKTCVADVSDATKFNPLVKKCAEEENIDLVIAAAGIIRSTASNPDDIEDYMSECIDVNVKGVMNTILPFLPRMKKEKKGQICVIVGALGNGTFGMDPIYEGSKNCIRVIAEGMMGPLRRDGVGMTIVSPGYLRTRMTEGKKTFMTLEPSYMADRIYEGMKRKDQFICDPYPLYLLTALVRIIPSQVFVSVKEWLSSGSKKELSPSGKKENCVVCLPFDSSLL